MVSKSGFFDEIIVAIELGALYGQALVMGYGWRWMKVRQNLKEDNFLYCVVSPDDNWINFCGAFINRILTNKNTGQDGKNDNTVSLLYNMIGEKVKTIPAK